MFFVLFLFLKIFTFQNFFLWSCRLSIGQCKAHSRIWPAKRQLVDSGRSCRGNGVRLTDPTFLGRPQRTSLQPTLHDQIWPKAIFFIFLNSWSLKKLNFREIWKFKIFWATLSGIFKKNFFIKKINLLKFFKWIFSTFIYIYRFFLFLLFKILFENSPCVLSKFFKINF